MGETDTAEQGAYRSLRERIQAADDVRFSDLEVDEWGVTLRVFSMTGADRATMLERYLDEDGQRKVAELYPALLIATCYDPQTGEHPDDQWRVFTEADGSWLNTKNSGALERVAKVALRLSGMDADAKERAGKD